MSVCCCSLAGTGACNNCTNSSEYMGYFYSLKIQPLVHKNLGKRVIEEFDKDGKVIKRITEEL